MELKGKTIVITGGGQGLGRAMAIEFAKEGANLALIDLNDEPLAEAVQLCKDAGGDAKPYKANVASEDGVVEVFDAIEADYGEVHGLINNAGILRDGLLIKVKDGAIDKRMSLAEWQAVIDVNLTGVFLTFRAALQNMEEGGRLIAIASTAALQGGNTLGAYAASKHGVLGLVRSLAVEVAKSGITCNAICPGFVETNMADGAVKNVMAKFDMSYEKASAMITARNPMARMIQPEEVASAAIYLASAGASSVNGHALSVSGGEI